MKATETDSTPQRETQPFSYFKFGEDSLLARNPLMFWKRVLKSMWEHDPDLFRENVKKQINKQQLPTNYGLSYAEAVAHLEASSQNTLAVDLRNWPGSWICVDVDISKVGSSILEIMHEKADLAQRIFEAPLIVKTATPGHLHLYYEASQILPYETKFKKLLPTRLGFKAEFIRGVITLAGENRIPLLPTRLVENRAPSALAPSIYPYNYQKNDNLYSLIEKHKNQDGGELIIPTKLGDRNQKMYHFFKVDYFTLNHLKVTNQICLDPPLPETELAQTIFKSLKKRFPEGAGKIYSEFSLTMRPKSNLTKPASEFLTNQDFRSEKALKLKTPGETINFIFYIEDLHQETIEDDKWMGRSFDYAISYILLHKKLIQLYFIKQEFTYVYWNGTYWQNSSENEVVDFAYQAALSLSYGAVEERVARRAIIQPLKSLCGIEKWPKPRDLLGYNFLNGIVYADPNEDRLKLVPHDPKYMHRDLYEIQFREVYDMDLPLMSVLSDMSSGRNSFLVSLRYGVFLDINPSYGNLAFILFGPGGAGKSALTNFLRSLLPPRRVGTIDDTLLSKAPASKNTLVKDKSLIILPDITNRSLSPTSVEFIKALTGRDQIATDAKYKDAINFESGAFLTATTNQAPATMSAFKDSGFAQRFVKFPMPGIAASERISTIGSILNNSRHQLVRWALSQPRQFVKKNLRADNLNAIHNFDLSDIEIFFMEKMVYEKNNRLTTQNIASAYVNYKKDMGDLDETKPTNFSSFIGRNLTDFNTKLRSKQQIVPYRTNKARGFQNIAFKNSSGKLGRDQESFKFKIDPELADMLQENPFKDSGFLYLEAEGKLVQLKKKNLESEAHNTVLAMAVAEVGLSPAQATRQRPLTDTPYFHLFNPLVDLSKIKKIKETSWFKTYKNLGYLVDLKDPQDSTKLASDELLAERFAAKKKLLLNFLTLRESINCTPPGNFKFINFKQLRESPTFKMKRPDKDALKTASDKPDPKAKPPEETDQANQTTKVKKASTTSKAGRGRPTKSPTTTVQQETLTKSTFDKPSVNLNPVYDTQMGQDWLNRDLSKFTLSHKLDLKSLKKLNLDWFKTHYPLEEAAFFSECLNLVFKNLNHHNANPFSESLIKYLQALQNFRQHATQLRETAQNFDYVIEYQSFETPYQNADLMEALTLQFQGFPLGGAYQFINYLNAWFGDCLLDAWALNATARPREPANYYGKALPGSSTATQTQNAQILNEHLQALPENKPSLTYINKGMSLFPFLYLSGDLDYGRLNSLPSSGLSGLKAETKLAILKFIAQKSTGLNFVELDLKRCHTVIAFDFFKTSSYSLPKPENLWPTLMDEFKASLQSYSNSAETSKYVIINHIKSWSPNVLKALLKTQWYKALNNGSVWDATDNLERARVDFQIDKTQIQDFGQVCKLIFQEMPLFKLVGALQGQLSQTERLYLPTKTEPFYTKTPSRSQENSGHKGSMTAMSRLFSNCEILVVIMVYIVVAQTNLNLMPISYEADGLLLVGKFHQQELPDMLTKLNQELKRLTEKVFKADFQLEFKNPT